jgi:hypothetical protein
VQLGLERALLSYLPLLLGYHQGDSGSAGIAAYGHLSVGLCSPARGWRGGLVCWVPFFLSFSLLAGEGPAEAHPLVDCVKVDSWTWKSGAGAVSRGKGLRVPD